VIQIISSNIPVPSSVAPAHPYSGKVIALTTKHSKHRALSPAMRKELKAIVVTVQAETDQFGTFVGDVPRTETARATALAKARLGLEQTGWKLGLATEGSFQSNPFLPGYCLHVEWIAFVDESSGLEILECIKTDKTNFGHLLTKPGQDIQPFLQSSKFGSHSLIVRPNQPSGRVEVFRGVRDLETLMQTTREASEQSLDGLARLETDMRADQNPTRMEIIEALGNRLASRLRKQCAKCWAPGWGLIKVKRGIPCVDCHSPTTLIKAEIHGCGLCDHTEEQSTSDPLSFASPQYCDRCNP
jgi:hypothetical protein